VEDDVTERDEAVKNVFAHFGAAYYQAEVLHRGLCNLLVWKAIASAGAMNRYRVEEHLAEAFKTTLGQIVKELSSCFAVADTATLEEAVSKRNFVAHHFWFERVHLMATSDGCEALVAELSLAEELFRKADELVDAAAAPFLAKLPNHKEAFAAALGEAMRGEPMEPLRSQRKLKKQERIIRIYEVPGKQGGSAFHFETDDGAIWQLCDVGLGWSYADAPDPNWPLSKLNEFLPATLDPRPAGQGPWHYDLKLRGASIAIRPGSIAGTFKLAIRRDPAARR
jgi:hypothetical protein